MKISPSFLGNAEQQAQEMGSYLTTCSPLVSPPITLLTEALYLIHKQMEETAIKATNLIAKAAWLVISVFLPTFRSLKHTQSLLYIWY